MNCLATKRSCRRNDNPHRTAPSGEIRQKFPQAAARSGDPQVQEKISKIFNIELFPGGKATTTREQEEVFSSSSAAADEKKSLSGEEPPQGKITNSLSQRFQLRWRFFLVVHVKEKNYKNIPPRGSIPGAGRGQLVPLRSTETRWPAAGRPECLEHGGTV